MPWQTFLPWSNALKTRACRQLLQHYLGAFFQEQLSLDQLSINLSSGCFQVKDVILNLNAINEVLLNNNIPFEVVKACVREINISVPWTSILQENSQLDIKNLEITIRPKRATEQNVVDTGFELSSMFNSMNTSMMIARECLKNETEEDTTFRGLETFAATIDSILARVKISLTDTIIRLEHLIDQTERGVALEIRIKKFEYFDSEAMSIDMTVPTDSKSILRPTAFTNKNFIVSGVELYTDEFSVFKNSDSMIQSCDLSGSTRLNGESMMTSVLTNSTTMRSSSPTSYSRMVGYETFDPVLCLTISGKQDVRLKLKQSDKTVGAKVEIHANFGSVNCLLTPKQLKSLIVLFAAYQEAALNSTSSSNLHNTTGIADRPMNLEDFKRIELILAEETRETTCRMGAQQYDPDYFAYGDSELSGDPSDSMFCSVRGISTSIDLESSYTSSRPDSGSSPTNYQQTSPHRKNSNTQSTVENANLKAVMRHVLELGQAIMTTKSQLHFSFISLCLLHQDIQSNETSLRDFADGYFANTSAINTSGILDERQIEEYRIKYSQACSRDHLSLIGKSLSIDFSQQAAENCLCLDLDIRFNTVDLCECLRPESTNLQKESTNNAAKSMIFNQLLKFNNQMDSSNEPNALLHPPYNSVTSSIQINITNFDINENKKKKSTTNFTRRLAMLKPFSDVNIRLAACQVDFDISILDRIHASINACQTSSSTHNQSTNNKSIPILNISTSNCLLHLRFPMADLQPISKRRPWWIQAVHKEILSFDLKHVQVHSNFINDESSSLIITSEEVQIYYSPTPTSERSHIGHLASSYGKNIKIILNMNDSKDILTHQSNNLKTDALIDSVFCRLPKNDENLPLRNKTTLKENRQILEVANTETINGFLSACMQETKMSQEINIPYVLLYIPDQVFLETLYNRFVNHLFMWESSAPTNTDNNPKTFLTDEDFHQQLTNYAINPIRNQTSSDDTLHGFQTCRSFSKHFSYQSSTDDQLSSDSDDDGRQTPTIGKQKSRHASVMQVKIDNIHLNANAPLSDKTPKESRTSASNLGELRIDGQDLTLALVDSYAGDPNLQYFCMMAHSALIYHNGRGTPLRSQATLREILGRSLPELLTRLPANAFPKYNNKGTMVRAAFEIRTTGDRETGKQKLIRGSYTIEGAMLHQRIVPKEENWLLQLMDLFDLTDEEIPGYIPSSSMIDWHLEFRHCAVHYQPVHFDTRCCFAIDSLALSNTYVKNSKTILLELNLDDWALFLAKQKREKSHIDLNDYVSIINGGAFEMRLCFNEPTEGVTMLEPLVDVRVACNIIHIHCCSDSGNAMIELIKYILAEGDLQTQQQSNEVSRSSTPIEKKRGSRPIRMFNDETVNEAQFTNDEHKTQMLLIEDAMQEDNYSSPELQKSTTSRYDDDDEDEDEDGLSTSQTSNPRTGSVFSSSSYSSNENSSPPFPRRDVPGGESRDFELIEREIGMCRPPVNGVCEVHVLTDTPIQIHEDHFSKPLERNDVLNPPKHLPVPVIRFSMRQISVVWYIYGGSDFAAPNPSETYQQPVQLDINDSVRFSVNPATSPSTQGTTNNRLYRSFEPVSNSSRHERGGPCRDLRTSMEFSIVKARCQFETYNEQERASSRFVFAIHEFEIRDRLLTRSEINKFLYLYTTEAAPRRTHADMLVVKILHTKPESYMMKTPRDEFENGIDDQPSSEPLECEIKVSLQPLRINIDQDTLVFMRKFFTHMASTPVNREPSSPTMASEQLINTTLNNDHPSSSFDSDHSFSPTSRSNSSPTLNTATSDSSISTNSSVFIKHFVFSPPCHIRIDYRGKLRNEQLFDSGPLLNLLIGLAQLSKVDIYLKRISYKQGLLGYEKLLNFLLNEWLNDIRPMDVIKGITPLSSVTQLVVGIRDLFYLPIDQYRRDGRIIRGIERGASSFTTSTALALIELSSQVVRCAHFAAQVCFELVSSSTNHPNGTINSLSPTSISGNRNTMVRNHPPPSDIREGVAYAVHIFRQSFNSTTYQLRTEAELGRQRRGFIGLIVSLLRQMPAVAIQPIVTTAKATENFLDGCRNQIDHDERNDDTQKYRKT